MPNPGTVNNPAGKGGFGDNPQNRANGRWKPENTFSYQLNRFKAMTISELEEWNKNTPKEVRTVTEDLAFLRIFNAREDINEYREVADRTEGKSPQTIIHEGGFFSETEVRIITDDDETYENPEASEENM